MKKTDKSFFQFLILCSIWNGTKQIMGDCPFWVLWFEARCLTWKWKLFHIFWLWFYFYFLNKLTNDTRIKNRPMIRSVSSVLILSWRCWALWNSQHYSSWRSGTGCWGLTRFLPAGFRPPLNSTSASAAGATAAPSGRGATDVRPTLHVTSATRIGAALAQPPWRRTIRHTSAEQKERLEWYEAGHKSLRPLVIGLAKWIVCSRLSFGGATARRVDWSWYKILPSWNGSKHSAVVLLRYLDLRAAAESLVGMPTDTKQR